jgi:hypothetical protein
MGRPPKKLSGDENASKPAPKGNTPLVGVRMEPALRAFLEKDAAEENRTLSNLILTVLKDWARRRGFKG